MRLLMFRHGDERRLGVLRAASPGTVVDVREALGGGTSVPRDVLDVIDGGPDALDELDALVAAARRLPDDAVRPLASLTVLPPLDPPRGNVIGIGRNYRAHAEEDARVLQTEVAPPTVFTKAITSITGAFADIPLDASLSEMIDWEVELGVVIGRRGVNVARVDALEHVLGYTVLNDITARDMQNNWGGQWFKGKSLDASCPVGPWLVTRDEIPDPQALRLRLRVNGVLKQDATTREMIHPVDELIEWLSRGMTLLPGALIATGTPEGVGFARTPPEFLRPGDVLESEIDGIGAMRNRIVAAGA